MKALSPTCLLLLPIIVSGQISIDDSHEIIKINFDQSLLNCNQDSFAASGLSPNPNTGQLDSDTWQITGLSDGDSEFGELYTSGDFARGKSSGNVSTAGIYSFKIDTENHALGLQPSTTDLSPGYLILKLKNNSSADIGRMDISYDIYHYNNENRSSSIRFLHASELSSKVAVYNSECYSAENADSIPLWKYDSYSFQLNGVIFYQDSCYYLIWRIDDTSGSGDRDEFAIDNIKIQAYPIQYLQDFEASSSDNWPIQHSSIEANNNSGASDNPSDSRIFSGAYSWQVNNPNSFDSLVFDSLKLTGLRDISLNLRLSASSTSPSNGLDLADYIKIYLALNDSDFSQTPNITINGKNNAFWSYNGDEEMDHQQIQLTYPIQDTSFGPQGGGNRNDNGDGISNINIGLANGITSLKLKIEAHNNASDEFWNLDRINISGLPCNCSYPTPSNISLENLNNQKARISFTLGNADSLLVLLRENAAIGTYPICNTNYAYNPDLSLAPTIDGFPSHKIVYKGADSSFVLRNLVAGTRYYLEFFPFNDASCYQSNGAKFDFIACYGKALAIQEGFDFGDSALLNWEIHSGISEYSTSSNSGLNTPSLKLSDSEHYLISPELCMESAALAFWIKGNLTDQQSAVKIEGLNAGGEWKLIDSISSLPNNTEEGYYRFIGSNKAAGYSKIKFSYSKSLGNLALDDLQIFAANDNGQAYTWTNFSGDSLYDNPINWDPPRYAVGLYDSLVFNNAASNFLKAFYPDIVSNISLENGTSLSLASDSAYTSLLVLSTADNALEVCNDCTLELAANKPIKLCLLNEHSNTINGTLRLSGSKAHQILSPADSSLFFTETANFSLETTEDSYEKQSPFGTSLPYKSSVIFTAGSNYYSAGTSNAKPFGLSSPNSVVLFKQGANFYFSDSSGEPELIDRKYSNFYYNQDGISNLDNGSGSISLDSLILLNGSLKFTGAFNLSIAGNIHIQSGDGLLFDPSSAQTITLSSPAGKIITANSQFRIGEKARIVLDSATYSSEGSILCNGIFENRAGQFTLSEGDSLYVADSLINSGDFHLLDDASLNQASGSTIGNSGNFFYTRKIPDYARASDYHFWSSPMEKGAGAEIGPGGELNGSLMYSFTFGGNQTADYNFISNKTEMNPGQGYVVAGCAEATFTGTPNNGNISRRITEINGYESYNLVGNPYPSAINAASFIEQNSDVIDGTIYLWSQNGNETQNSSKQYIAVNTIGTSAITERAQTSAEFHIATCQGFFVEALESIIQGEHSVSFTNAMRYGTNSAFKSYKKKKIEEKGWIYLTDAYGDTSSCLYALSPDASNKYDAGMDAKGIESQLNINFQYQGKSQSILAIPKPNKPLLIPIRLQVPRDGYYRIGTSYDVLATDHDFKAWLIDLHTAQSFEIGDQGAFSADLKQGLVGDRFYLFFSRNRISNTEISELAEKQNISPVYLSGKRLLWDHSASIKEIRIIDLQGRKAFEAFKLNNLGNYELPQLPHGSYVIIVKDSQGKQFKIAWHNRM